jgi:hypothetical protein
LITFKCRLVSPLHTAEERYSNVQTCAPYILGSTLRGAMLSHIIRRLCPAEHFERLLGDNPDYHAKCPGPCGAKSLFDSTQTRFSFGRFPEDRPPRAFRSRVAIDRARFSVAEGALLQFDVIAPAGAGDGQAQFSFEVETADEFPADLLYDAARWAGEMGVGAFRNQGYGLFVVDGRPEVASLPAHEILPPGEYRLEVDTPYVLPPELPFGHASIRHDLGRSFGEDWFDQHIGSVKVEEVNLGYVGRWCYEDGKRHTRAVALPGSALRLSVTCELAAADATKLVRGLGEWAEVGFGRFTVAAALRRG